jgi:hypothetical protein
MMSFKAATNNEPVNNWDSRYVIANLTDEAIQWREFPMLDSFRVAALVPV